jgi:hypothetical protein
LNAGHGACKKHLHVPGADKGESLSGSHADLIYAAGEYLSSWSSHSEMTIEDYSEMFPVWGKLGDSFLRW